MGTFDGPWPCLRGLLAASLLAVCSSSASAERLQEVGGMPRCEADVKLVTPADWRCQPDGGCTTCVNITEHESDLLVRCVGEGATDRRPMPTHFQFSICHGGVRQPA